MTSIVLLVLVAAWAGYLFLWVRDARGSAPPGRNGIRSFSRQLGSLGGTASVLNGSTARPSQPAIDMALRSAELVRAPRTTDDAARRRRQVLALLGALALLSLAAVPMVGGPAMTVHILFDLSFLAYGYAVIRRRHLSAEHEIKVRMLYPDRPPVDDPVVVPMRRTVNG